MSTSALAQSHRTVGPGVVFTFIVILLFVVTASTVVRAESKPAGVSTPQVSMMLEPYAPNGAMRTYTIANGVSYWTTDLPIYQGDSVKLDVFVATGADDLQELKVRVDNVLVADINKAPWTTTLSTAALGEGYHFVEAWAQVSGQKPQFATHSLTFFVSPPPASSTGVQPIAQVKGQEQILANGQVVTVPLDPNGASAAPQAPAIPAVLASAETDPKAMVKIVLTDSSTNAVLDQDQTVQLSTPAVASIVPSDGSTAQRFAYILQRGSQAIVTADKLFPADATRIRLQPRTSSVPGLLPGTTTLWVWGVDSQGNYGAPVSATVQIPAPSGG
jgi:hypothetical protein